MNSRAGIVGAVGGFLPSLPPNARTEISRLWPSVDLNLIDDAFGEYVLYRDHLRVQATPEEMRKILEDVARQAADLLRNISKLREMGIDGLIDDHAYTSVSERTVRELEEALLKVTRAAQKALGGLPSGQRINVKHWLARRIAAIARQAGERVDARPKGAVCSLTAVLLDAGGEAVSSVAAIVRPALKNLPID